MTDNRTLIIAHRGASREAPENTLAAFQKAIELGADAIELDVRQAKDGVLVVVHDSDISGQAIKELTCQQILDLNGSIPTLEQALNLISGKAQVHIELKVEGCETEASRLAIKYLGYDGFFMVSFIPESLRKIKSQFPQVKTGLILGSKLRRLCQLFIYLLHWPEILSFVDLFAINWKLWKWGFAKFIPASRLVTVWTVDESTMVNKLLRDSRILGVTTNDPRLGINLKMSAKDRP